MSHILKVPFSQGYVSTGSNGRSADDLDAGELVTMESAYYKKNDPTQAWRIPGRSLFGDAGSGTVKGLAICQFDNGTGDRLIASVGTSLLAAVPGTTGTFSSLVTGLNSEATRLTACHQDDRWYLGNGFDQNMVLMPDATIRAMGLNKPTFAPTTSASAIGTAAVFRPTAQVGTWSNGPLAMDSDITTSAGVDAYQNSGGGFASQDYLPTYSHTWFNWLSNSTSPRTLRIYWSLYLPPGGSAHVLFEKSENLGGNWTTIYETYIGIEAPATPIWTESQVTADSNLVQFRATIGVERASPGHLSIFDINITTAVGSSFVTTTDGIYYAYTEVYATDNLESPPSDFSALTTLFSQSSLTVTRGAITNTSATHWRVYRIADGITPTIDNLGLVSGDILISDTTWTDTFDTPIDEQALPIIGLLTIGDLSFPLNDPPPPFLSIISWRGSICGISRNQKRSWYYSEAGLPESFPSPYVVTSFPLDEHDILVGQMAVGETLVILCEGAMLALDDIPRVTDGQFNSTDARPLRGHPGCVGNYAYTTFSVAGEPKGAWVSPFGVYVTNGVICECISTDLAWENEVNVPYLGESVLRWDAKNLILWFEFDLDGDGLNDREMPFHMAEMHVKKNGKPKIGQPTAKATSIMTSALIGAAHYRYSGHPSNGSVYIEESGYTDAATGSNIAISIVTGQYSAQKTDLSVIKASLNHSDFGTGETGTITVTLYRDASNTQNSREQSINLNGNRSTTVGVGRAGELVDFSFDYAGTINGALGGIDAEIDGQGRSGSAARWLSSSATP